MKYTHNDDAMRDLLAKVEAGKIGQWYNWNSGVKGHGDLEKLAYNGSLDAAKVLHEAVTPYPDVDIEYRVFGGICDVTIHDVAGGQYKGTSTIEPSRAWLIAIIRVLISQDTK